MPPIGNGGGGLAPPPPIGNGGGGLAPPPIGNGGGGLAPPPIGNGGGGRAPPVTGGGLLLPLLLSSPPKLIFLKKSSMVLPSMPSRVIAPRTAPSGMLMPSILAYFLYFPSTLLAFTFCFFGCEEGGGACLTTFFGFGASTTATSSSSARNSLSIKDGSLSCAAGAALSIDANGHITMPLQTAVQVRLAGTQSNVSDGDTVLFASERFDINADFNASNYTFTAPVTGKYLVNFVSRTQSLDSASSHVRYRFLTSNINYEIIKSPDIYTGDQTFSSWTFSLLCDFDANLSQISGA